jgi:hypothetical protein
MYCFGGCDGTCGRIDRNRCIPHSSGSDRRASFWLSITDGRFTLKCSPASRPRTSCKSRTARSVATTRMIPLVQVCQVIWGMFVASYIPIHLSYAMTLTSCREWAIINAAGGLGVVPGVYGICTSNKCTRYRVRPIYFHMPLSVRSFNTHSAWSVSE